MSTKEMESKVKEVKELRAMQAGIFKVSYKTIQTIRFDQKAFKTAHRALYEEFAKKTESRRFAIV